MRNVILLTFLTYAAMQYGYIGEESVARQATTKEELYE